MTNIDPQKYYLAIPFEERELEVQKEKHRKLREFFSMPHLPFGGLKNYLPQVNGDWPVEHRLMFRQELQQNKALQQFRFTDDLFSWRFYCQDKDSFVLLASWEYHPPFEYLIDTPRVLCKLNFSYYDVYRIAQKAKS